MASLEDHTERAKRILYADKEMMKAEKGVQLLALGILLPTLAATLLIGVPVETKTDGAVAPYGCGECHVEEGY
jgi:hypothetical protein